jgi:hypothetical protein
MRDYNPITQRNSLICEYEASLSYDMDENKSMSNSKSSLLQEQRELLYGYWSRRFQDRVKCIVFQNLTQLCEKKNIFCLYYISQLLFLLSLNVFYSKPTRFLLFFCPLHDKIRFQPSCWDRETSHLVPRKAIGEFLLSREPWTLQE